MANLAFVASTLPVPLIKQNIKKWDISEIIVTSKSLSNSYEFLIKDYPHVKLSVCPKGYKHWIFLFKKLTLIKLSKKNVFFFHECCWFVFDVIISILKVKGEFYPQVGLDSLKKNGTVSNNLSKERLLLGLLNMREQFIEYEIPLDNDEGVMHVLAKQNYTKEITCHSIDESLAYRVRKTPLSVTKTKKILILIGREPSSDQVLSEVYRSIIEELFYKGYLIYIKNHPREEARLKLSLNVSVTEIDPYIPAELVNDEFLAVIGCASTGLISFGVNVFSIINFSGMSIMETEERKKHLTCLSTNILIRFPFSKSELFTSIDSLADQWIKE